MPYLTPASLHASSEACSGAGRGTNVGISLCGLPPSFCFTVCLFPVQPRHAGLLAPLEPLMHSLQFMGDLAAHEVIDGDAIHIAWQVSGQGLVGGHSPGGRDKRWV